MILKVMVIQTNKGKTGGIQAPAQNWKKKLCEKCRTYVQMKGLASHCKAEATFTFHSSILTLLNAF